VQPDPGDDDAAGDARNGAEAPPAAAIQEASMIGFMGG
jgi:hypothetical protein